jgi:uncharacterized membrane protein
MYKANMPPQTLIYFTELRKLINAEMLNADFVLGLYEEGLTAEDIVNEIREQPVVLTKNIESSGMKSGNLIVNLSAILFILVIVLVLFFFFWLASKYCPLKYRDKIKDKFDATIKKTFWNGIIKSITISYLVTAIAVGVQI